LASIFPVAISFTGCMVGPNYRRPQVDTPATFRAPEPLSPTESASLADLKWWEVFEDRQLQDLVHTALAQNYDLRDAAARVEAARANLGITRADEFPNVGAAENLTTTRYSRNGPTPLPVAELPNQNRTFGSVVLNLVSFEIDIWGRLRRATQAARAELLAAEEGRKVVVVTLISEVASAYFHLRELDQELDIARRTLAAREDSLRLIESRRSGGVSTRLDVSQAQQLVYSAAEVIPALQQQIAVAENQMSVLLGANPGTVARGIALEEQKMPPAVPPGLPSSLLEQRPDIRAAEQRLIAANALIGVARAAYFPQLSVTGFLGGQSTQLSELFAGPNSVWSFAPQIVQPIFTAGRIHSNVMLAEAEQQSALAEYQKTIQVAFSEVSNALIARQRLRESREKQELLVEAIRDRTRLAYLRYHGGVDTLLNALDSDRDQFQAELTLAQLRLNELLSVVELYKALGGGWQ
jgi:multidrug efflux system outer membrane protein